MEKFGPIPSADCNHIDGDDFDQLLLIEWSTAGTFPLVEAVSPRQPHSYIKSCYLQTVRRNIFRIVKSVTLKEMEVPAMPEEGVYTSEKGLSKHW